MNWPNILTVARLGLTVVFIYFFGRHGLGSAVIAFAVFTAASVTDYLDGYLARKHNLITAFGKIMDPIADKFLILAAFFLFMKKAYVIPWMFAVICFREVLVTVLRLNAVHRGVALAAEKAGKLKTVLQIAVVYLIMIFHIVLQLDLERIRIETWGRWAVCGLDACMLGVVIITVWSGVSFLRNNRKEIFRVG